MKMHRCFFGQLARTTRWLSVAAVVALAMLVSASATAGGQDVQSKVIPRSVDGKPDFSGFWQVLNSADWDIEPHHARPGTPAGFGIVVDGPLPYRTDALEKRRENWRNRATQDVVDVKCYLPGVPRVMYEPYPFMIDQTPDQIIMIFEYVNAKRNIYMSAPHPKGPLEFWMGDSRGTWDGDTLVVDVTYFNADTWLDRSGNFHSEDLHVVERYQYITPDHIQYTATLEDPQVYTRPFNISMVLYRHKEANFTILDDECYAFGDRDIKPKPPKAVQ
jgi:hypothetical protein